MNRFFISRLVKIKFFKAYHLDFEKPPPIWKDILNNHTSLKSIIPGQIFTSINGLSLYFDGIHLIKGDVKIPVKHVNNRYEILGVILTPRQEILLRYKYFETLPRDIFNHLVHQYKIEGKDLYDLCAISKTIAQRCDNRLFHKLLKLGPLRTAKKDYRAFYENPMWYMVTRYPEKPWDWYGLSSNSNITWEIAQANPDKPWNWARLSANLNITWEIVQANPNRDWDWEWLSRNPNITWEIIQANPDKPWNWFWLSRNPNITWEIVQDNPDKPWDWCRFQRIQISHSK